MGKVTLEAEKKRRRSKELRRAIDALADISLLDNEPNATLADAVKLAEQALRAIDGDRLVIALQTREDGHSVTLHIISAAGNMDMVREVAPHIKAMLDGIAEAEGGKALEWSEPVERHGGEPRPAQGGEDGR